MDGSIGASWSIPTGMFDCCQHGMRHTLIRDCWLLKNASLALSDGSRRQSSALPSALVLRRATRE